MSTRFNHSKRSAFVLLTCTAIFAGCISTRPTREEYRIALGEALDRQELPFTAPRGTKIDSIAIDDTARTLSVYLSPEFAHMPFREGDVERIYKGLRNFFGERYTGYHHVARTLRTPIEDLVPNFYRSDPSRIDKARLPVSQSSPRTPVVTNASRQGLPVRGLLNRNISLWHSHGWYFNNQEARWEWQRPRLFQSVEDLGPLSFTIPYLIPMLEKAGARVYTPRERDVQLHEVIVDNDSSSSSYIEVSHKTTHTWKTVAPGFRPAASYGGTANPFSMGTARRAACDAQGGSEIRWVPTIPETGTYAVYVSYVMADSNVSDAEYTVCHAGGRTQFRVNQQIGGGTWEYLGEFMFRAGTHPDSGQVILTNKSGQEERYVTADAVRFGGGMGAVERGGATSGRPKYVEGARYYLQFAGAPDTLVYSLNNNLNDYKDDYQSRAEFGNYLYGAPFGPNRNRSVPGLKIPMDLSLAFHTDAGTTSNDTTVGTLLIYSVEAFDSALVFPDGVSRLANRDFADIMQTQIVEDLRTLYDPAWRRRELRNADYSEAVRPNFPGVLLELLSHQNFLDMKFMQDPQFRFDVSRAIYKSMLRFLSVPDNPQYVVQPLPVSHVTAELTADGNAVLRWRPKADPLEPTALPEKYIVYTRYGDGGFDNGTIVDTPAFACPDLPPGVVVSFKVAGINAGGEGFPSEILAVGRSQAGSPPALVVNGFHRISAPATVDAQGYEGFSNMVDAGVPDRIDYNFTGQQFNLTRQSPFRSNDSPGHGASYADDETRITAGNTLDFTAMHAASLMMAGFSVSSCSADAVQDSLIELRTYSFVDLMLGEQRSTPRVRRNLDSLHGIRFAAFPPRLREPITRYVETGRPFFVSGSYVGSDLYSTLPGDSSGMQFARDVLKCSWVTGHAVRTGDVTPVASSFRNGSTSMSFTVDPNSNTYAVEAPDALAPVKGGAMLLRYSENLFGAAVGFRGERNVVAMGFPFETITTPEARDALMKGVVEYLRR